MIYFLIALPFFGGFGFLCAWLYRLGVQDGMKRINGAVELPPMREKNDVQVQTTSAEQELLEAVTAYEGGTIQKKR